MQQIKANQRRNGNGARLIASVLLGGALVAAGAVAMVQPSSEVPDIKTVVSDVMQIPLTPLLNEPKDATNDVERHAYINETRIESGDNLSSILSRLGIQDPELIQFIIVNKSARSAYRLIPGRTFQAAIDEDGKMLWTRYFHTPSTTDNGEHVSQFLEIIRTDDGRFEAREVAEQTNSQTHVGFGVIESSLFAATDEAGIPDGITIQMAEVLGGKIDFMRDLRKGDTFRVVYETRYHQGRPTGVGRVLAVEFINAGVKSEAYWFQTEKGSGNYFDSEGKSLKAGFLRNAIPFTRISSTFGMRKHPIHNSWRGHKGVDFAAPSGTPIQATADGVVEFIGKQGGYGNTIILRHRNNITTLYAHQSRFAAGLKRGDRVSQGQIIGYVGSTGWSTGPHLHYEFRVNNTPVDPLGVKLPEAQALDKTQLKQFAEAIAPLRNQLERMATLQQENPNILKFASR